MQQTHAPIQLRLNWHFLTIYLVVIALALLTLLAPLQAAPIDFVREVRPIFERHCYECHGSEKQKSGLRLDIKAAAFKGGDAYGASIVAKSVSESPLIQLITSVDPDERMPPQGDGLSAGEIVSLQKWIAEGAIWPEGVDEFELRDKRDHWSFNPLANSANQSIDSFVEVKLAEHGLCMSPETDRVTWLRRVTLDLTGLPPTPEQVAAFVHDQRDDAYERVVDRLLSSPRYGERWAQHWLDVVRYADTHGFEVNTERPNAWPYRDYVIRAFNNDTPYDSFIQEQIVGDALGEDAATGFLVTASVLLSGQIGKDAPSIRLARQDSLDEMVNNVGQTFLGLSVGCARCHDHKFDPISARDYYSMQALVAGVEYADRPIRTREAELQRRQAELLRVRLASVDVRLAQLTPRARPESPPSSVPAPQAAISAEKLTTTVLQTPHRPTLRPGLNIDRFQPVPTRRVRFTILDTNGLEPCLDEVEVFNAAGENVALASRGTHVTTSGDNLVPERHQPDFINDGQYGNSRSWMSNELNRGWVILEFSQEEEISLVIWSRDREGKLVDRNTTAYRIETAAGDQWRLVADATDRNPVVAGLAPSPIFTTAGLGPAETAEAERLLKEKSTLESNVKVAESTQLVFAGKFRAPDEIHLLNRGDPEQPLEEMTPAVLSAFGSVALNRDASEQERRAALANWIASPHHPLTARVMVNRIWQGHFGSGIVQTPSDFGNNGLHPTHPELLDWLAVEFIRCDWSVKHMHRLIVLSGVYRQSSLVASHGLQSDQVDANAIDADASLLWRYPSRRIEAEVIRDSMLAASGQLSFEMYGRGYDQFDQRGGLSGFKPIETITADGSRRMIYAHKVRRETEAVFGAFDCPDAGQSTAVRRASTTPIQALNLFNSRITLEQSKIFAARVHDEAGDDLTQQIQLAFQIALSRRASEVELRVVLPIVSRYGIATLCRALFNSNEFMFIP